MSSKGLVVVSSECTNCARLLETLKRIKNHGLIVVDYSSLTPMQRVGLTAVPTLIQNDGKRIVGTAVFEYINAKYYQVMTIDSADLDSDSLSFASLNGNDSEYDHSQFAFL